MITARPAMPELVSMEMKMQPVLYLCLGTPEIGIHDYLNLFKIFSEIYHLHFTEIMIVYAFTWEPT